MSIRTAVRMSYEETYTLLAAEVIKRKAAENLLTKMELDKRRLGDQINHLKGALDTSVADAKEQKTLNRVLEQSAATAETERKDNPIRAIFNETDLRTFVRMTIFSYEGEKEIRKHRVRYNPFVTCDSSDEENDASTPCHKPVKEPIS